MKCRVCREPAVIEVRRHNAGFARTASYPLPQPGRTSHRGALHGRSRRTRARCRLGREGLAGTVGHPAAAGLQTDGLYIGLGIEGYSEDSRGYAKRFAASATSSSCDVDLPRDYGYDVKTGAAADHRVPCLRAGSPRGTSSTGQRSTGATTSWPRATTWTMKPPYCSATCSTGTSPTWPGSGRSCLVATAFPARSSRLYASASVKRPLIASFRDRLPGRGMPDVGRQPPARLQRRPQRHRGTLTRYKVSLLQRVPERGAELVLTPT